MSAPEPALFRAFPEARGRIAHRAFLAGPTPVEPLALPGLPGVALQVKRDERCGPLYGGNKPRKLEFVLGHALARGRRHLVTTGGLGTNHGLATAILGRACGLATTLVLVRQPLTPEVRAKLLLFPAYGARVLYGGGVAGAALQLLRVLAGASLRRERPLWVPAGGSSPRGNLGWVSAGLELAEQVRGGLPEPARIFVPVGTGGTLVGLALGLRLAGLSSRLTGVLVTDILPPTPARLARAARRTWRLLRAAVPRLPEVALDARDFELDASQLGPGYGAATAAARRAVADAAPRLGLETTYTGKCLAALQAAAEADRLGPSPVLFWNTYNAVDVTAAAPLAASASDLPAPLQRLLRDGAAAVEGCARTSA